MEQEEVLTTVEEAFRSASCPEHFTNYMHCQECADHDSLLRSRDRSMLKIEDVNNPAWNPVDYLTAEGFVYYFPALARLALSSNGEEFLSIFVPYHLYKALTDQKSRHSHRWLSALSKKQCDAILSFVRFVAHQKRSVMESQAVDSAELEQAVIFWEHECHSK